MKKFLIVFLTFIFCFGGVLCYLYFNVKPEISLKGDKELVLNLGEEYKETGFKSTILDKDVSGDVEVVGNVDVNKVGTYEIKYSISSNLLKNDNYVVRKINVIDSVSPEIKLVGENISFYVGENYKEPGYNASDNYDGDITSNVKVTNNIDNKKAGTYEVIYTVIDSSNNSFEVKRKVEVKTKPDVTTNKGSYSGYGIPVLMYHYFYDKSKGETGKDNNWMEISSFEEQLKYLDENDWYFPTWGELYDFVTGKIILPKKSIVITADDGHESFFEYAVPVINKYDVKVTSFVITGRTNSGVLNNYRNDNINFQSHTNDMHKGGCSGGHGGLFRCIDYNKGLNDLKQSINVVGSSDALAYPYGDVTDNVLKITKDAGFKLAFTTKYGKVYKGMNPIQLPRVRMSKGVSLKGFISAIS